MNNLSWLEEDFSWLSGATPASEEHGDAWEHPQDRLGVVDPKALEFPFGANAPTEPVTQLSSVFTTMAQQEVASANRAIFIRQHSPEWFAARSGRITASIAGACLGLDKHCSRAKAYRIIKGLEVVQNNAHITRGRQLEQTARHFYEARHRVQVAEAGFVVHPELNWLGCSADGFVGPMGCLEIKCPKTLPTSLPDAHKIQCMVQLACTGRWFCDYLAFVKDGEIFEFRVIRDVVAEHEMLMGLWAFYVEHIQPSLEPESRAKLKLGLSWAKGA